MGCGNMGGVCRGIERHSTEGWEGARRKWTVSYIEILILKISDNKCKSNTDTHMGKQIANRDRM